MTGGGPSERCPRAQRTREKPTALDITPGTGSGTHGRTPASPNGHGSLQSLIPSPSESRTHGPPHWFCLSFGQGSAQSGIPSPSLSLAGFGSNGQGSSQSLRPSPSASCLQG